MTDWSTLFHQAVPSIIGLTELRYRQSRYANTGTQVAALPLSMPVATGVHSYLQNLNSVAPVGPRKRAEGIGRKNGRARIWAKKGTRPRLPADQRYQSAYLFGAICPMRGKGVALMLPVANTATMQLHLEEISLAVAPGSHGAVIMDCPAWHATKKLVVPENHTMNLPPLYLTR